ncbi:MAG: isoprenylcysteine carboxylmethyltransferase family protein [Armatimonadetes bacterium]|nr:isoprenylcysteine carboxylmethyltransferase family protein [Armatimonadota bacterium]
MTKADSPGVHVPPPFIFAAAFGLGLGLHRLFAWSLPAFLELPGIVLVVAGLGLMFVSVGVFWSRRTTIMPNKSATEFVVVGPYRFTRNPMYVGMSVAYVGLSFAFSPAWPLVLLPLAVFLVGRTVIAREEEYLLRTFGSSYEDYRSRVRRWI